MRRPGPAVVEGEVVVEEVGRSGSVVGKRNRTGSRAIKVDIAETTFEDIYISILFFNFV